MKSPEHHSTFMSKWLRPSPFASEGIDSSVLDSCPLERTEAIYMSYATETRDSAQLLFVMVLHIAQYYVTKSRVGLSLMTHYNTGTQES